ncbi:uncharacterized protein [Anoplolepis gracilipes]|uniref:uncharacterized protein n=1 Tax=Anoplolepis gracilipes TaxID=354296 RepID=UPI003B9F2F61
MATITSLPAEVIEIILGDENVSIEDVLSFSSTCKRFQEIRLTNKFWATKFYQRCSSARKKYNTEKQKKIFDHSNFEQQIKEDELNRIVSTQSSRKPSCNLTSAYNFGIIIRCLKQYRLMFKRNKFINMPEKKQLLERLLTIVAQYFDPHISFSVMKTCFDNITEEVLSHLKTKYPGHSIFSTSPDQFSDWRNNNIKDNFWDETEAKEIMCILQKFVTSEFYDYKLKQLLITLDPHKNRVHSLLLYFDESLRSLIYHTVARRLGIRCVLKPDEIPDEDREGIAIIWQPKYDNTENLNNANYFMIVEDYTNVTDTFFKIVRGRYNYLSREALFNYVQIIAFIIHDYDFDNIYGLEEYEWELNIIIKIIQNGDINITKPIKVRSDIVRTKPKIRNEKIKFAIGMIVKYLFKNVLSHIGDCGFQVYHFGVIIGWHFKCEAAFIKESLSSIAPYLAECENQHICSGQCEKFNQPHYLILIDKDKICYVQQDDLSIYQPEWIDNVEIGRYFSTFNGTHYVPNKSLAEEYPNDIEAIPKILLNIN